MYKMFGVALTTRKTIIYDAISKTVLKDRLKIGGGDNFVIWGEKMYSTSYILSRSQ